ncbi:MAG: cyclic pyranopterin monophosphate synthase MoaC [Deltaproteobacteria bacterium]|jgi:cyclic pyranopterin phosphate synthase|nr:cyclic pyranopterin monophosphate synthase MoaC [Deltaproteobacteria bacterium]
MPTMTHLDEEGRVRMVDVSEKSATAREAVAHGVITMLPETFDLISEQKAKKGNVLETARIAGIMAAKKTAELIPMCHPLSISFVQIDFFPNPDTHSIRIEAVVRVVSQTGVEMEAFTAATIAALTIYDMCKSYDRAMTISDVYLIKKSGGKSGIFERASS